MAATPTLPARCTTSWAATARGSLSGITAGLHQQLLTSVRFTIALRRIQVDLLRAGRVDAELLDERRRIIADRIVMYNATKRAALEAKAFGCSDAAARLGRFARARADAVAALNKVVAGNANYLRELNAELED